MSMDTFSDPECISNFQIAHLRKSDGYSSNWYDKEEWNNSPLEYFIKVPKDSGPLYFIVETYYQNIIPNECTSGTIEFSNGE